VGDHLRILLGVVVHFFLLSADTAVIAMNKCSEAGRAVIVVCMRCVCIKTPLYGVSSFSLTGLTWTKAWLRKTSRVA
jgi:hypothetical protein